MFGRQRDQSGILIELSPPHEVHETDDDVQILKLRNLIWCVFTVLEGIVIEKYFILGP